MQRWELPAQKTGTGRHDYYSLGATVGDEPGKYFICVASNKKIDPSDVTATLEGHPVAIGEPQTAKALLGRSEVVMLYPTREQMLKGVVYGAKIKLASKRGGLEFTIPEKQFVAMLAAADKDDRHLQNVEVETLAANFDSAVADKYLSTGTGKITGQAFLKTRGGDVRLGAGNTVTLVPNDSWTQQAQKLLRSSTPIERLPAAQKEYLLRTMRDVKADAQGNFEFANLPAGEYLLYTIITWEVPSGYRYGGMETTGGKVEAAESLKDGETLRVILTR